MAPFATLILAVPALVLEGPGVIVWLNTHPSVLYSLIIIFGSGVLAFCLNFSIFYVIHSTTAVTFNVAGNLKVSSKTSGFCVLSFHLIWIEVFIRVIKLILAQLFRVGSKSSLCPHWYLYNFKLFWSRVNLDSITRSDKCMVIGSVLNTSRYELGSIKVQGTSTRTGKSRFDSGSPGVEPEPDSGHEKCAYVLCFTFSL